MLGRLWILQEVILSNTIVVVSCEPVAHKMEGHKHNVMLTGFVLQLFISELHTLAYAWASSNLATSSERIEAQATKFVHAFLNNGDVTREEHIGNNVLTFDLRNFGLYFNSRLRTSKPRDFILATMPLYQFYTVPKNARRMTFSDLFLDLWSQVHTKTANPAVALPSGPAVSLRHMATGTPPAIIDVPEPACLGDMAKLLCEPRLEFNFATLNKSPSELGLSHDDTIDRHLCSKNYANTSSRYVQVTLAQTHPVDVSSDIAVACLSDLITLIRKVGERCQWVWKMTAAAQPYHDLVDKVRPDSEALAASQRESVPVALRMITYLNAKDRYPPAAEWEEWVVANANCLVRVAALMSCGLGTCAYEWSKRTLTPVWSGRIYLALVPRGIVHKKIWPEFLLAAANGGSDSKEFCLLARCRENALFFTICRFSRLD